MGVIKTPITNFCPSDDSYPLFSPESLDSIRQYCYFGVRANVLIFIEFVSSFNKFQSSMTSSCTPRSLATLCRSALLIFALLLTGLTTQAQTTRYVSTTGTNTDPASATSWATSTTNLQGAIDASGVTQVWVATGLYTPGSTLNMRNGVAIYGGFVGTETTPTDRTLTAPLSTTISGGGVRQVFRNLSLNNTALLDGFVIAGGNGSNGGGMYNGSSCSPTLTNCSFLNNTATNGGGMFNVDSSPTLTNCVVFGNGGNNTFYNDNSTLTATYSLFDNTTNVNVTGLGNLTTTVNPFVSTTSTQLAASSAAIDVGNKNAPGLVGVLTDLQGLTRSH